MDEQEEYELARRLEPFVGGGLYTIICAECDDELQDWQEDGAAHQAAKADWTIIDGQVYCAQCAKEKNDTNAPE